MLGKLVDIQAVMQVQNVIIYSRYIQDVYNVLYINMME